MTQDGRHANCVFDGPATLLSAGAPLCRVDVSVLVYLSKGSWGGSMIRAGDAGDLSEVALTEGVELSIEEPGFLGAVLITAPSGTFVGSGPPPPCSPIQ